MTRTPLTTIAALARSGAPDRAWLLFEREGYADRQDDPAALAVKGRLLKDRAMRADGETRAALLTDAAAAYAAADALAPAPYLLINVAALAALAGDTARAASIAGEVLDRLDHEVAETPYYLAATRAEALLLRADRAGAERALERAAALLPHGWDERAGTLRQFARILTARGEDDGWLDQFRAPTSLHYAGHLGIAPSGAEALRSRIERVIADHRIGFAFGALAAGADLLVAEAVLAAGAELHVALPCTIDAFARQSVASHDAAWLPRYDACLAAAASIRTVAHADRAFDSLATGLAAEVAMGAALLHARRLAADAVQLVVIDEGGGQFGDGASTVRDASSWPAGPGRDQVVLRWPRDAAVPPSSGKAEAREGRALIAVILIAPGAELSTDDELDDWIDAVRAPLRSAPLTPSPAFVQPHGNALLLGFPDIEAAADAALAMRALPALDRYPTRIAGAYGLVHIVQREVAGSAVATATAVLEASMTGAVTVNDLFADALALRSDGRSVETLGDFGQASGPPLPLYALIDDPD
jgi:hypothetical protein